ncbi:MORN repeat-containing protein 1-like [Hypomesus transpacificus]|uniref:MORN repeat-containing protein 1-like n=1 Tax=Hypomesus transpacificus TaxID=137520 RepID=UPI001F0785F8|nr:MORN repeat-containing protein 1-like [Hypomesus transpacificus]
MAGNVKNQKRNPSCYVGEAKNLLRNGFGMYVYPNSFFRYEGQWDMGEKHGHGKLLMKDGSYYEGDFSHGEIEGNGKRFWAKTGHTYSGQFSKGELHGYGAMERANGERYEGEFSSGLRDGHGFLEDQYRQTYKGSFHENKRHGEGQMQYRNGDQYEGCWLQDQRQGHGVMQFGEGSVYEGQWRNNLFNGQGSLIHCSGVIYEGVWLNGKPLGGASNIVIEGGDVLEVFQESPFSVEVQLQTKDGEKTTGENGRVLQISAGIRLPDVSPSAPASLLKMFEDVKALVQTPFGFQVVSYPLMERAFESPDSGGPEFPLATAAAPSPLAVAVAVAGAKSVAQADSSLPEGEWEFGSGSDGQAHGRGATVPHSYLDGKEVSMDRSGKAESSTVTECSSGLFPGQQGVSPANQRVKDGQAKFQDIMLALPPPDFIPYQLLDEMDKRNVRKLSTRVDKLGLSQDKSSDSRSGTAPRLANNTKVNPLDSRTVRPGEYVIMVKEVTSPPFLEQTLPPAFTLLRVCPAKSKSKMGLTDKSK